MRLFISEELGVRLFPARRASTVKQWVFGENRSTPQVVAASSQEESGSNGTHGGGRLPSPSAASGGPLHRQIVSPRGPLRGNREGTRVEAIGWDVLRDVLTSAIILRLRWPRITHPGEVPSAVTARRPRHAGRYTLNLVRKPRASHESTKGLNMTRVMR